MAPPTQQEVADWQKFRWGYKGILKTILKGTGRLGRPVSTYGGLFGRRILSSLAAKIQRKWSNDKAKKSSDFESILKFLSEQVVATGRYVQLRNTVKQQPEKGF